MWAKTKTTSKVGFDKLYGLVDKLGPPVNRLSNKLGSEAFWPTTLDKESDKAARILKSFCSKPALAPRSREPTTDKNTRGWLLCGRGKTLDGWSQVKAEGLEEDTRGGT